MIDEYQAGTEMAWAVKTWSMKEQDQEIDEQQHSGERSIISTHKISSSLVQ